MLASFAKTSSLRRFSSTLPTLRTVRDVLDEKRGYLSGEGSSALFIYSPCANTHSTDLKQYLKNQYAQLAINKTDTVAEALDKMIRNATSVLVVMDNGQVAGLTSDRDYLKLAQKRKQIPGLPSDENMQISEIMTPASKLVSCTYADTVETCEDMMVKNKVRFLPVLHANKLHGVLSFSDFLARPSRFEPDARRAIFAEENVNIVSDDYSFSLSDLEGDKIKEELAKRVESIKNRKL